MSRIFYIMGKSAAGKDSICRELLGRKTLRLKELVLYTTRPKREGERHGREYYFVDDERYRQFEREGRLIESRSYHTTHGIWTYFTADDGQIDLRKWDYLGIGTLESFAKLRDYFGEEHVVPIYIEVEDGERLIRAVRREQQRECPEYQELCRRFLADCSDFSGENLKKAGIVRHFVNEDSEGCVCEIESYIRGMV